MEIRIAQAKLWPIVAAALPTALLGLALTFASGPAAAQQWTPEQRAELESDRTAYFAEQHARAEKGRRLKKARRLRAEAAEIEALYGGESA